MFNNVLKKTDKLTNMSIISTFVFCIIGIILMVFPDSSLRFISYAVAVLFMAAGIFFILRSTNHKSLFDTTTIGVCMLIPGVIIMLHPELLETIIPIFVGAWIIVNSIVRIRMALALHDIPGSNYIFSIVLAVLEFICGILLVVNPQTGSLSLTAFMGIMLLIYSISDLIDLLVLKAHVSDIRSAFKELETESEVKDAKYKEKD